VTAEPGDELDFRFPTAEKFLKNTLITHSAFCGYLYSAHKADFQPFLSLRMDGQDAFQKFQQQLKRATNQGGGKLPGGPGLFAGGGLIVALIASGIVLNASLFNGTGLSRYYVLFSLLTVSAPGNSGRWSPSHQVYTVSSLSQVTIYN
jgi:hypothetical protein